MKSATILISFITLIMFCACGNNNSQLATQQLPSDSQSTEGKLGSVVGMITTKDGFYYFSTTNSNSAEWYSVDKQKYVKRFAGKTVRVRGFFNYDPKSITIVNIEAMGNDDTKDVNKQAVPHTQK